MSNLSTTNLFPVPITVSEIPAIPKKTVNFIKKIDYLDWIGGEEEFMSEEDRKKKHLSISKSKQVLDDYPELAELKKNITEVAERYWREVLCVDWSLNIQIRNSWVTWHKSSQWNRPHVHTCSMFTSTTYIQAEENSGDLIFEKNPHYLNLFPAATELDFHTENFINTKVFSITPKPNMTVCFPSHINHFTRPNNSNADRYALNVDWWFNGRTKKEGMGFYADF